MQKYQLLSGDLNKYEFLTRKDLKYKPNALDKARLEFSPLGKAFSVGLDKTADGYQEEGVIKLLKNIRDGIAGNVVRPNRLNNRPNNDDDRPNRLNNNDYDDDSFDTTPYDTPYDAPYDTQYDTPYDTPYTSDDEDDEDDTKKI